MSRFWENTSIAAILIYLGIVIAGIIGWCMNIYKLFHVVGMNTEFFIRIVGVFAFPVGGIAGYL